MGKIVLSRVVKSCECVARVKIMDLTTYQTEVNILLVTWHHSYGTSLQLFVAQVFSKVRE